MRYVFAATLVLALSACIEQRTPLEPRATTNFDALTKPKPKAHSAILVGAGDIAECDSDGDERTAALLDDIGGIVFTAGDNAYEFGTPLEFAQCYDPSWGRHKARTRPAAGNHDY